MKEVYNIGEHFTRNGEKLVTCEAKNPQIACHLCTFFGFRGFRYGCIGFVPACLPSQRPDKKRVYYKKVEEE